MAARTSSAHEIVGRQRELAVIEGFLDHATERAHTLVITGEAGIGKTRVWKAGLAQARARGFCTLVSRPGGADVRLAFAGLTDLLADVSEETRHALPAPQRLALAVALMLEGGPDLPDERVVAAAFLGVVRRLARQGRVLLAVDDVQWLDASSARVLEFALRRLEREPVGVLMTLRAEPDRPTGTALCTAPDEERLQRIQLGQLSVGAVFEVVRARLGMQLARPVLLRVHETSGGNPFYALQIAQALRDGRVEPSPGEPLPVPPTLRELLAARLGALSAPARHTLLIASALTAPSADVVEVAVGDRDRVAHDLDEAAAAGVVELADKQIRFVHPLLASTVYATASPPARRQVHRRLAEVASTREERARHLALATVGHDAGAAFELEAAADEARARGAPGAAAELLELAASLTPMTDRADIMRRRIAAAETEFASGNADRARALLDTALAQAPSGPERAAVLLRLGESVVGDDIDRSASLLREAEREAGPDDALRARVLCALGKFRYGLFIGYDESERCARRAAELAAGVGDSQTHALALALVAHRRFQRGHGIDEGLVARAVALEDSSATDALDVGEDGSAAVICAEMLIDGERLDSGGALLERLCRRGRRAGDAGVAYPLHYLALLEFNVGHWYRAEALAREAVEVAVHGGRETLEVLATSVLGLVEGGLGRVAEARRGLEEALALAAKVGRGGRMPRYGLGLLELSLEDYDAAWGWLGPAIERIVPLGVTEPAEQVSDGVEALAQLGRAQEAVRLLEALEGPAGRLDRRWALAASARNRGFVLAAEDDLAAAEAALTESVALGEAVPRRLELGRSLLALGTVQRRLKRKQASRATLGRATAVFDGLGAPLWAQRARRETGRIGGRVPYEDGLSATEEQIAQLVRLGHSNKEIATTLHLSVKTVEWNLSKVYRKLGIHSRTQL